MSRPLPSASAEGYLNLALYPLPSGEQIDEWLIAVRQNQSVHPETASLTNPMIYEEEQFLLGTLRFVDYYLWNNRHATRAATDQARLGRILSKGILETVQPSDLELDDLQQNLRLQVVRSIRNYKAESGNSVFTYLSYGFINEARETGIVAIRGGFSASRGKGQTKTNSHNSNGDTLYEAMCDVFMASTEEGYSDALADLESHPKFCRSEPLTLAEPIEEEDESFLPYDHRLLEPTAQPANQIADDDYPCLRPANNLDRIFSMLDGSSPSLTEKEKLVLRLHFEDRMNYEAIGLHPNINRKKQFVYMLIRQAKAKIRQAAQKASLADLLST